MITIWRLNYANDCIKLSDIKQILGVSGIVWALHDKMPGEVWQEEEIAKVKAQCEKYGFNMVSVAEVMNLAGGDASGRVQR